jgi:hypothetical protein
MQTMFFFRKSLLISIIGLFMVVGCHNEDYNSIGIGGTEFQNGTFVDTFTVMSLTVREEVVRTDNKLSYNGNSNVNKYKLLGYYNDYHTFGSSRADLIAQFVPPDLNYFTFPDGGILDSAVLVLRYWDTINVANTFYGGKNSRINLIVEENGTQIRVDTVYYSDKIFNGLTQIGRLDNFRIEPKKKVMITEFVKNGKDTIRNDGPQIRIPIDKNYARNKFVDAPRGSFDNAAALNAYIKGLKIRVEQSNIYPGGQGNIVYLDMQNSGKTKLNLYYHTSTDTLVRTLQLYNVAGQANTFVHDYTATEVEAELNKGYIGSNNGGYSNSDRIYIQGTAGVKTQIAFPYLKNLVQNGHPIVINKAELVVTPVGYNANNDDFVVPTKLTINHGMDKAGTYIMLPDYYDGDWRPSIPGINNSGKFDKNKKTYNIQITKYIQDLVDGKDVNEKLYLTLEYPSIDASKVVLYGSALAGVAPSDCMKLRIIYSDQK